MDTSFFMLAAIEGRHYAVFTTSLQGGIADEAISITPMVAFEVLGDCRASLRSARNDIRVLFYGLPEIAAFL